MPLQTATTLLKIEQVSKIYGSKERQFVAVKDINLSIQEGEFVALLGPSGCGKSTLLRMMTCLIPPSSGQILYRNQAVRGINPHTTMVFQSFALYPWLSVLDNVALALEARGNHSPERFSQAEQLVDLVGLDGFERAYPRELSGGMRQKVGFARALAVQPELLCLDEPFSALDVLSAEALRSELLELWTSGRLPIKAILMVSHNIEEAIIMADRIIVMGKEPGHIVTEFAITLPHPRTRKMPDFENLIDPIYSAIAGHTVNAEKHELGAVPRTTPPRLLPQSSVPALAGLLEHLNLSEQPANIYKLRNELGVSMPDLLQTIEMAALFGFTTVTASDLRLTSVGQTFASETILNRKDLFATRAQNLPILSWIIAMLRADDDHSLPWRVFFTALQLEFPDNLAKQQLDTAIAWGRYAELLDYDDRNAVLMLDPSSGQLGLTG